MTYELEGEHDVEEYGDSSRLIFCLSFVKFWMPNDIFYFVLLKYIASYSYTSLKLMKPTS